MNKNVRVRFAPSPTGKLHAGNARTALYNFLFARSCGGSLILRIEDTDAVRSSAQAEKGIIDDLNWLGFSWDEGPCKGGDFGPYRQTERLAIYTELSQKLLSQDKAYECFCTQDELKSEREKALRQGKPPKYSGKCRKLPNEEVEKLKKSGQPFSIRFAVPSGEAVRVNDLVKKAVCFERNVIGDFIIIRSDGMAAYNFAVVADDGLMKISHVIRGDDHLANTPKQILLYEALGWKPPLFAHIPMILGPERVKLSKRTGMGSVVKYREDGFSPIGILNYFSLLGWNPGDKREILNLNELIEAFSLERVSKSAAVFDIQKMRWVNATHLGIMESDEVLKKSLQYIKANEKTRELADEPLDKQIAMINSVKGSSVLFSDIPEQLEIYTSFWDASREVYTLPRDSQVLLSLLEVIKEKENFDDNCAGEIFAKVKALAGVKGKKLFHPIRLSLTGNSKGPELSKVIPILGKETCIERLEKLLGDV